MSRGHRTLLYALFAATAALRAQQLPPPEAGSLPPKEGDSRPSLDQLPPPEDKTTTEEEKFAFNPVKSRKAVEVGEFYFKKGDYKAAAGRFIEATKWNDGNADAWLKLGAAEDKMNDAKAARAAWEKYLQLAPQAKNAAAVKGKLGKLK
jgi:tetratricopeptide (TPR) repeat protein